MKQTVYIAAPFAASPQHGLTVEANVELARKLLQLALNAGLAPVHVHDAIMASAYGDDGDAVTRERGLQVDIAIACAVAAAGGEFWALEYPDGTLSRGVARELAEVRAAFPKTEVRYWQWISPPFQWCSICAIPRRPGTEHRLVEGVFAAFDTGGCGECGSPLNDTGEGFTQVRRDAA